MAISQLVVLAFLGLVGTSTVSGSCATCLVHHPQQKFCDADFVFKVRPVSTRWLDNAGNPVVQSSYAAHIEYKVKLDEVFKGAERVPEGQRMIRLHTPRSLCQIDTLEIGVRYLLSGKMKGDKMEVTNCGLVEKWSDLTPTQRRGIRGGFQSMCSSCRVYGVNVMRYYGGNEVIDEMSSGLWTRTDCFYNPMASMMYGSDDCETKHGLCMPKKGGAGCQWEGKEAYGKCYREREYKWQLMKFAELGQFAWTCPEQCKDLTPRRLKYKCKKATRKLPPCEGSRDTVREFPAPSIGRTAVRTVAPAKPTPIVLKGEDVRIVDPATRVRSGLDGVASPEIINVLSPMLDEES